MRPVSSAFDRRTSNRDPRPCRFPLATREAIARARQPLRVNHDRLQANASLSSTPWNFRRNPRGRETPGPAELFPTYFSQWANRRSPPASGRRFPKSSLWIRPNAAPGHTAKSNISFDIILSPSLPAVETSTSIPGWQFRQYALRQPGNHLALDRRGDLRRYCSRQAPIIRSTTFSMTWFRRSSLCQMVLQLPV